MSPLKAPPAPVGSSQPPPRAGEATQARLSVIGLGKLGACSAACFAAKGFDVIGVDINQEFVDAINAGTAPVHEPRLQETVTAAGGRLRATRDYEEAIQDSSITFLIVPTPSQPDGRFSDKYLRDVLGPLADALGRSGKDDHIFAITSTVSPGTTEGSLIPLIAARSRRRLNEGFGVAYNPEFIALGSVISDFLRPDLVLIGESAPRVGDALQAVYEATCENEPQVARMSVVSAEIAKLSLNAFVTMKISFANTLANICESIPGASVDDITKALGADKRISPHYLKGGLSFGGPCFPRDNRAFSAFAAESGVEAPLASATDAVNQLQIRRLADLVVRHLPEDGTRAVAVLGLAYKPNTPVIDESPALRLVEELLARELEVAVYDPVALDNVRAQLGDRVRYASTARECMAGTSSCVITTGAEEWRSIDDSHLEHDHMVIIDCWRVLDPSRFKRKFKHVCVGRSS